MYNGDVKYIISNIVENIEIEGLYIEDNKLCCKKMKFKSKFCNYYQPLRTLNIYKADYVELTFLNYIEILNGYQKLLAFLILFFFCGTVKSYKTSMKKCNLIYCILCFFEEYDSLGKKIIKEGKEFFLNDDVFPEVKKNGTIIKTFDEIITFG